MEKELGFKSENWDLSALVLLHTNCRTVQVSGKLLNYPGLSPSSVNPASRYYQDPNCLKGQPQSDRAQEGLRERGRCAWPRGGAWLGGWVAGLSGEVGLVEDWSPWGSGGGGRQKRMG